MIKRKLLTLVGAASVSVAGSAFAGVDLEAAKTCIAEQMGAGSPPTSCIETAQSDCSTIPQDASAVATLCYVEAKDQWSAGIAEAMQSLSDSAPEDARVIAQIEAKYDILAGFMQCDRLEELALAVSDLSSETIGAQKARCTATASGIAYARLLWRAQSLR